MLIDQESEGGNASGVIKPQSMLVSPSGGQNIKLAQMHEYISDWKDWMSQQKCGKSALDRGEGKKYP